MRACVAPVCDLKTEVEVITHNGKLKPCWGNASEVTFKNIRKMPGSKIVQVKGLMPQKDGISRKTLQYRVLSERRGTPPLRMEHLP